MKISIFGLGYVGAVSVACLASKGHTIIGVDVNQQKVDLFNEGKSPIIEEGLGEMLLDGKEKGLVSATTDVNHAILNSELSFLCVGTPSRANGSLSTKYIENVCREIGEVLKHKTEHHIIVSRSTMLPGTNKEIIIPYLEKYSGKKEGVDFSVAYNPEFMREGTAIEDFYAPPKTVLGTNKKEIGEKIAELYAFADAPMLLTSIETAEMVKYVDNNFHALKITFANEIGAICKSQNIDSHAVMDIMKQDLKLNISPTYLTPGFAFGGSCLPKDVRALSYFSKMNDLETPLLQSLMQSNNSQVINVIKNVIAFGKKKVGIAGFSFKAGTDDLRESPIIEVIETLIGKGFDLKLYDKNVSLARLVGANKDYINHHIPHISELMVDSLDELMEHSDVIIIGNKSTEFDRVVKEVRKDQIVYDLVRVPAAGAGKLNGSEENYEGLFW